MALGSLKIDNPVFDQSDKEIMGADLTMDESSLEGLGG
ncbi:MAG: hypothetical protein ACI910_000518 [Oleispira sp.]|jgi:hypothetical protein